MDNQVAPTTISEETRNYLIAHGYPLPEVEKSIIDRTYHYLPYHLDSTLEKEYLEGVINHLKSKEGVEFYYNGDETLTNFRIRCYAIHGSTWKLLDENYYPDFIMLTRKPDNSINKILIIETKGAGFAAKFEPRKQFMDNVFVKLNNEKFGRERFSFLYIEDTLKTDEERIRKTADAIDAFLLN